MKKVWKIIIPVVCIIVVAITFNMLYNMEQKILEKENINENQVISNEEIINENNVDIENTLSNSVVENNINMQNIVENDNVVIEEDDKLSSNKQERAIKLVEQYWGEDSTVYFTNEGINSEGEYIVAVRQKTSTAVKDYFKVNIETKKVEIDY